MLLHRMVVIEFSLNLRNNMQTYTEKLMQLLAMMIPMACQLQQWHYLLERLSLEGKIMKESTENSLSRATKQFCCKRENICLNWLLLFSSLYSVVDDRYLPSHEYKITWWLCKNIPSKESIKMLAIIYEIVFLEQQHMNGANALIVFVQHDKFWLSDKKTGIKRMKKWCAKWWWKNLVL